MNVSLIRQPTTSTTRETTKEAWIKSNKKGKKKKKKVEKFYQNKVVVTTRSFRCYIILVNYITCKNQRWTQQNSRKCRPNNRAVQSSLLRLQLHHHSTPPQTSRKTSETRHSTGIKARGETNWEFLFQYFSSVRFRKKKVGKWEQRKRDIYYSQKWNRRKKEGRERK